MMQSAMFPRLVALRFDANDPLRLATFWADALHWKADEDARDAIGLVPTDDTRLRIPFRPVPEKKAGKNRIHLDLTSTCIDDQAETVVTLVQLGARHSQPREPIRAPIRAGFLSSVGNVIPIVRGNEQWQRMISGHTVRRGRERT